MKCPRFLVFFLLIFFCFSNAEAQKRKISQRPIRNSNLTAKSVEKSNIAVVVDERLAVLRDAPSLFAMPVLRMRRGRIVSISGTKQADGVTFYRVSALPKDTGWVQSEAVVGKFRRGDDERLAKLVQSSEGFDQIERAQIFLENFENSPIRPAILLLFGDLMEESALKLSSEAGKKLDRKEMAATGAPLHSFYLNYTSLDRYRKLNVNFLFNPTARLFHYDGASWREIVEKFSKSQESAEAQKRLDSLKEKMQLKN